MSAGRLSGRSNLDQASGARMWHLARAPRTLWLGLLCSLALLPHVSLAQSSQSGEPPTSRLEETVEVRMIQTVLSVIDKDVSDYASVRQIPKDDFIIKLDGKELSPDQKARTVIDELCDETTTPSAVQKALGRKIPDRPLILLVDFNYLDAQGRFNVARALREAAGAARDSQVEYKIYGYTRDLEILTPTKGFVKDPAQLLIAAQRVEDTAYTNRNATGASEFEIQDREGSGSSSQPGSSRGLGISAPELASSPSGSGSLDDSSGQSQAFETSLFDEIGPEADFNPSASLGAIERIMVIHSSIPWLKTVVLFSSEEFGFADPQREENEIQDLLQDRKGYKFWPVVAGGLSEEGFSSRILSSLAGNTGGHTTRGTGELYRAIAGASEQLSCYYLISVPVAVATGSEEYKLTVQLDREGKDAETAAKYFRYNLDWDRKTIRLRDPASRQRELRMAALFSPDDFPDPPMAVTIDYPSDEAGSEPDADVAAGDDRRRDKQKTKRKKAAAEMRVRFRVRLSDLDWGETGDEFLPSKSNYSARFIPALVVEHYDERGSRVVCEFDVEKEGRFRTSKLEVSFKGGRPREEDPLAISAEFSCPVRKPPEGLYVARGIITDLVSQKIAAGRSSVFLQENDGDRWTVLTPRIETVTNREVIWHSASRKTTWDRDRNDAWRELATHEAASVDDRVALCYVLCGPRHETPEGSIEHVLFRRKDGEVKLEYFLDAGVLDVGEEMSIGKKSFCPQARVLIEPYTITEP
ncbi:MAG: hypothetical protein OEQ13_10680, partial [Acidobacteriota bacterium]|nr:hypothetical protein [Acidobacteriota bacterium]